MATTKVYRAELNCWREGEYGLVITSPDAGQQGIDPLAVWEVRTTSQSKVSSLIIASLLGHEQTFRVERVR